MCCYSGEYSVQPRTGKRVRRRGDNTFINIYKYCIYTFIQRDQLTFKLTESHVYILYRQLISSRGGRCREYYFTSTECWLIFSLRRLIVGILIPYVDKGR